MTSVLIASKHACGEIERIFGTTFDVCPVDDWLKQMRGLLENHDDPVSASSASQEVAGVILIGKTSGEENLIKEARTLATECRYPVFEDKKLDALTITKWMCEQAIAQMASARQSSAQSRASAAILRAENENLQHGFQALEAFLYELGGPKYSKVLELTPGTAEVTLVTDGAPSTDPSDTNACPAIWFTQRLPLSARGLIAIDIYCTHVTPVHGAKLCLSISDLGDRMLGSVATLPLSEINFGWNRISLPFAIAAPDCEAQLKLTLEAEDDEAVLGLASGWPVPMPRFRTHSTDGPCSDAPLAMRAWRGLAGARLPTVQGPTASGQIFLSADQVPRPRLLKADDQDMGFEPVEFWPKQTGILVHPPAQGMTVGIVENIPVSNLMVASGIVNVAGAESPPLDFAMAVVPAGFASSNQPLPTFKSWLTLSAKEWGEVQASVGHAMTGHVDFILATKVAVGPSNGMAWALFRGFRLGTRSS